MIKNKEKGWREQAKKFTTYSTEKIEGLKCKTKFKLFFEILSFKYIKQKKRFNFKIQIFA